MARVSRPDEEDKESPEAPLADEAGGAAGGDGATPTHRAKFQDISRLLYANQGRGKEVADAAIHNAQGLANTAQSQLAAAQGAYRAATQAGTASFTPATAAPIVGGGGLLGGRPTTTLNYNAAPNIAQAEQTAAATYKGPNSLGETPGVDLSRIQGAFDRAGQAYSTLAQSPTHGSGGIGAFDDMLAKAESGGRLRAEGRRFQGLRDSLNSTIGDTHASTAARNATNQAAAGAQGYLADQAQRAQVASDMTTRAENEAADAKADDEAGYQAMFNMLDMPGWGLTEHAPFRNGFNGTLDGLLPRDYYNLHKDEIKRALQSRAARAGGSTYGIGATQLLAQSGYDSEGRKK